MNQLPPVNHIFVDFENVHEVEHSVIGQASIHLTLLLGPNQKKLDANLVEKLLQHAGSVHLVRLANSGRNALDFALAYYVGRAAVLDPSGCFHIISRDTGYDPLVAHLRSNAVRAHRHPDFSGLQSQLNPTAPTASAPAIPRAPTPTKNGATPKPSKAAKQQAQIAPALDEHATRALEHLKSHPKSRPTRQTTLARHIRALLGNKLTEAEATHVIAALRQVGYIDIIEKGAITYRL
jgi:hypothetical protein